MCVVAVRFLTCSIATAASIRTTYALHTVREFMRPQAQKLELPVALKLGAQRGVNPALRSGGDGVVVIDVGVIERLCSTYPQVGSGR